MHIPNRSYKIKGPLKDTELEVVTIFKERASDFLKEREKVCPKQIRVGAKRLECGEFSGDSNIPNHEALKLYYLSFRFFYQQKEPSNFMRVRNIISNISNGDHEILYLKSLKDSWQRAMSETHMSDFLYKEISGKEILQLWFNATLFHSDIDKRKRLKTINNLLTEDLTSSFLFLTVLKAGASVGLLYKAIENLSSDNPKILIPDDYVQYDCKESGGVHAERA